VVAGMGGDGSVAFAVGEFRQSHEASPLLFQYPKTPLLTGYNKHNDTPQNPRSDHRYSQAYVKYRCDIVKVGVKRLVCRKVVIPRTRLTGPEASNNQSFYNRVCQGYPRLYIVLAFQLSL